MKQRILFSLIVISVLWAHNVFAQADISMATHWYNRANYNPASIARPDYLYLFTNIRRQWNGVEGAPTVFNVQASEYIHKMHSAFGLSLVSDNIGVSQAINPLLTYAFRIANNQEWSLSLGMSAGVFSRIVDGSAFEAVTVNDVSLYSNLEKNIRPDANVGVEFQSSHFILGVSSTHLFSFKKDSNLFLNANHRYGYVIYKNSNSELFNYNVGLQFVNRYNLTVLEGNASIRFKHATGLTTGPREIFELGVTYRSSSQMTFLFGLNLTNNIRIGYAYDQSFIPGYNLSTTHEIMLEYRIPTKAATTCIQCRNESDWYH